jgi:hypothetical protein
VGTALSGFTHTKLAPVCQQQLCIAFWQARDGQGDSEVLVRRLLRRSTRCVLRAIGARVEDHLAEVVRRGEAWTGLAGPNTDRERNLRRLRVEVLGKRLARKDIYSGRETYGTFDHDIDL